jgi:uncharacterized protein YjbJ (UPF0337 family)
LALKVDGSVKRSVTQALLEGFPLKGNRGMNWDRMEGEWKQRRGKAVHHWGKLMNDELAAIAGKYEELVGKLQERYGIAKEAANRQVKDFKKIIGQLKRSNSKLIQMQKALHRKETSDRKRIKAKSRPRTSRRAKIRT